MADFLDTVARMRAFRLGRAVPIVSQRQVVIQPDAMVLTLLAMAGEDTSVHAIAVGRLGEPAQIRVVPDPRDRDAQYDLLRWLLPKLEAYYAECREAERFPQVWVSSGGALGHLDTLADRLRFTNDDEVKRLGELLTYAGERSPVAGQQALVSATGALSLHFATGQQEAEDEHLGALLAWIEPKPGRDIWTAVAEAEEQPMSVQTDPWFDANTLQPALSDHNKAVKAGDASGAAFHANRIVQMLENVIRPIYANTQRAAALLTDARWAPNPALSAIAEVETSEFHRFMEQRDEGYFLPYRDRPKAAALKMIAREDAVSNVEAEALRHDIAAREKGVLSGQILRAVIADVAVERIRPQLFEYELTLETRQERLHLRENDVLWAMDGPAMSIRVLGVTRSGTRTTLNCRVCTGKRRAKASQEGEAVDFGPKAPDWQAWRKMVQMAGRLSAPPWTHEAVMPPAAPPSTSARPHNVVRLIEGLT